MVEFHPGKGEYTQTLSPQERQGAREAILYLKAQAGEPLDLHQMHDLAASVRNIALAQQLGLLPPDVQEELMSAADSIYNLPKF